MYAESLLGVLTSLTRASLICLQRVNILRLAHKSITTDTKKGKSTMINKKTFLVAIYFLGLWGVGSCQKSPFGLVCINGRVTKRVRIAVMKKLLRRSNVTRGQCVCKNDTRRCPGGISVRRIPGNRCRFPACPKSRLPRPQPCSLELKICPDGTRVGRDPFKKCRFRPCPKKKTPPAAPSNSIPRACSREHMICPDGPRVGRDPFKNCRFFPCP